MYYSSNHKFGFGLKVYIAHPRVHRSTPVPNGVCACAREPQLTNNTACACVARPYVYFARCGRSISYLCSIRIDAEPGKSANLKYVQIVLRHIGLRCGLRRIVRRVIPNKLLLRATRRVRWQVSEGGRLKISMYMHIAKCYPDIFGNFDTAKPRLSIGYKILINNEH